MLKIVHIQQEVSTCTSVPRKKSKKQELHDAAVETVSIQRAIDRENARKKLAPELAELARLEATLQKLIEDNNLQHYQFETI